MAQQRSYPSHRADCRWVVIMLLMSLGCAENAVPYAQRTELAVVEQESASQSQTTSLRSRSDQQGNRDLDATNERAAEGVQRRMIYESQLKLIVDHYSDFEMAIASLVTASEGYIASSNTSRTHNDRQSGVWEVRVPVTQYSSFMSKVDQIGFVESRTENAQDVTDQYVDLETRIRNSQQLEKRVLAMLEEPTGKLSEVLEIERELARLRQQTEGLQGRLRVMKNRSAFSTITLLVEELEQYGLPTAPTLSSRLVLAWQRSLSTLQEIGESGLVFTIMIIPWALAAILIGVLPYFVAVRRFWRS